MNQCIRVKCNKGNMTLALGGVCQNISCGDLDGVVQNYEIVATTTTCTNIKIRKQH